MTDEKLKSASGHRIPRFILLVYSWIGRKVPGITTFLKRFPPQQRAWIGGAIGLGIIVVGVIWNFRGDFLHGVKEFYGPDVVVSVLPANADLDAFGERDLLYEFIFTKEKMSVPLRDSNAVEGLMTTGVPISINRFTCKGKDQLPSSDLYALSVLVQNRGHQTANDYKLVITFSGQDKNHRDPGVRIAHAESDALKVDYLYQQEPDIPLPQCVTATIEQAGDAKTEKPSALARMTYQELGLTRDLVIVKGTLEAHLFQIVDLLIKVPATTKKFAILYHVECNSCRFFYRTSSYGQVVQLQH